MKFKRTHRSNRKSQLGQAMVETVIVLPVFIFFILGMIQMTMMHQARLMLEYAAFNAARTGSVWNADVDKMRRAALISMIASRPSWPIVGGVGKIDNYEDLILSGFKLIGGDMAATAIGDLLPVDLPDVFQVVKVDILSPTQADVESGQQEIDFDQAGDDFEVRRLGQLTIRLTFYYNLTIPFANWVIWNSWYLSRSVGMNSLLSINGYLHSLHLPGLYDNTHAKPFLAFDAMNFTRNGQLVSYLLEGGAFNTSPYECMKKTDWLLMAGLPKVLGVKDNFFIPIITTHTIRMQSNHFVDNLPSVEEASCSDSGS